MAEEITHIVYESSGRIGMKKNEVLNVFQDRKTHNLSTPIDVTLYCHDKRHDHNDDEEFSETAEMRTAMLENIVHINRFGIFNYCKKRNENLSWFNYLLQFIQTDHGGTKYDVEYHHPLSGLHGSVNHLSLEHAIKLSDALLLNMNDHDNDNSHIEKFSLAYNFCNVEAFQTIFNAVLETGVPYIKLRPKFLESRDGGNTNNNNINFTGLSTNMSVKQLDFNGFGMLQQNWRNLFISIKGNTGLEKLHIDCRSHRSSLNNAETVACFKEMLRKNITLIDVEALFDDDNEQIGINNVITIKTKFNRKWNQYLMKRKEEEEKNASTITIPSPPPPAHLAAAAERKRRFKMGCLFHAFRNKQVMRDTVLFHFLSESPDLLIDNEVQQNRVFRNRKRPRRTCGRYE